MHQHHQANVQDFSSQTGHPKFLMIWFCKLSNSILGKQGKLLEYCHLIANHNGPHGPTLTATSLDGLRKEFPAE
jgi:hypothetical protein